MTWPPWHGPGEAGAEELPHVPVVNWADGLPAEAQAQAQAQAERVQGRDQEGEQAQAQSEGEGQWRESEPIVLAPAPAPVWPLSQPQELSIDDDEHEGAAGGVR